MDLEIEISAARWKSQKTDGVFWMVLPATQ
jgi:hypothetical protein